MASEESLRALGVARAPLEHADFDVVEPPDLRPREPGDVMFLTKPLDMRREAVQGPGSVPPFEISHIELPHRDIRRGVGADARLKARAPILLHNLRLIAARPMLQGAMLECAQGAEPIAADVRQGVPFRLPGGV